MPHSTQFWCRTNTVFIIILYYFEQMINTIILQHKYNLSVFHQRKYTTEQQASTAYICWHLLKKNIIAPCCQIKVWYVEKRQNQQKTMTIKDIHSVTQSIRASYTQSHHSLSCWPWVWQRSWKMEQVSTVDMGPTLQLCIVICITICPTACQKPLLCWCCSYASDLLASDRLQMPTL